jgi:hypothetical protein
MNVLALADLVERRVFCVGFGVPQNYMLLATFFTLSLQIAKKVVSKKRHFSTGFIRVFSDRVEPYSNDRGCHRLLLTGDSPTSPGSEYVNMLNRIDREVC